VAVLGLRNLNQRPEAAWLQTALSELLGSELAAGERLRRVPAESVTRMKRDLSLPDGESLSAETLQKVRATLGVDYVIGGSYLALPGADGALRLDLTLQDAQSGDTLASVSQTGKEAELFDLVSRAGQVLRSRLGGPALSLDEAQSARRSLPASTETARLYAEGLQKLRIGDALGARDLLQQAAQADPEFPLTHAALADAYGHLGHVAEQQASAKRAFDASAGLPRTEQLQVEAQYRLTKREWPRAIELYRALVDFYPDSIEYGLQLATVQVKAARAEDALATLETLRKQARGAADDPNVDLEEAQALDLIGDFKREAAAGQRALDKAKALGARHLIARATFRLAYPTSAIGDRKRAMELATEAGRLFDELGDPLGSADAVMRRGNLAWAAGDLPSAEKLLSQSIELYRGLGAEHLLNGARVDHAGVLNDLGRYDDATKEYEEALAGARKLGNQKQETATMISLGQQLQNQGKMAEAEARLREGLDLARKIGKKNYEGVALESLGELRMDRGDPAGAAELEKQSVEVYTAIGDQTGVGNAKGKYARAKWWMGQPHADDYAAATAILSKLGEKTHLAGLQRYQAEVALDAGRLDEAESLARASVTALAAAQAREPEAYSKALLVRVLIAAGKLDEAQKLSAELMISRTDWTEVGVGIAAAELAAKQPAAARARLEKLLANPENASVTERLTARILLAQTERALGRTAAAQAQLKSVADEARKAHLIPLVKQATALR
jgi:tetratricopeptide (TPR) repeat protein